MYESRSSTPRLAIRRTIHYAGRVQGVGFRMNACRVAAEFNVTGYVKNLADGRVELVAEGEPEELDRLLAAIGEAMHGTIQSQNATDSPASGEYFGFTIQR